MPSKRKAGVIVSSYTIPTALHTAARARARQEGTNLTAIIRVALRAYVGESERGAVEALADRWEGYGHGRRGRFECSACDLLAELRDALADGAA